MSEKLTLDIAEKRLEEIARKMEDENTPFEEYMKCYEEAFELISFCYKYLNESKQRIININERLDVINKTGDVFDE